MFTEYKYKILLFLYVYIHIIQGMRKDFIEKVRIKIKITTTINFYSYSKLFDSSYTNIDDETLTVYI